jgi:M6 family metalloprotease-like protein
MIHHMTHHTWRCSFAAVRLTCTLAFALFLPHTVGAQTPRSFGFSTSGIRDVDGFVLHPVFGEIPLLTILVDFTNASFPADQPPGYYEALLFATEQGHAIGSVVGRGGFFEENSLGQFRFTNAGAIGPFHAIDNPDTLLREDFNQCGAGDFQTTGDKKTVLCGGREWSIRNAILAAAQSGFDFRQFDTVEHDGILQRHELMIMVVFAKPGGTWGQNRSTWPEGCLPIGENPLYVCGPWVDIESDAGVATIAHELSHALGVFWEGYGNDSDGSGDENFRYSTMGATTGTFRDLRIWHLDPFAKFKLGWVEPKIIASDSSGDPFLASQCLVLPAIERARLSPLPLAAILYDPSRGKNEYFMLEYRRAFDSNYDGRPWRTSSIGLAQDRGLAVWAIRTKANTEPLAIPSKDGATNCGGDKQQRCQDSAIHIYPPSGGLPRVGFPQPGRGLWTAADGGEGLYWVETDSSALSPFALRVAGTLDRGGSLAVEINLGSCLREFLLDRSFWEVPPGILSYDRRFLDDLPVPLVVHSWIHPRFRLERTVRQWVPPGDPVQVQWSLTPTGTEPTLVRVRIIDDTPSGFIFNSDSSELIFDDVRLNDSQTHTMSYELTPSRDLQSEGNFPVLSEVFIEAADGSQLDTPVELESFVTVFDPDARRNAGAPPDVIPSPVCGNGVRDPGEQCDDGNTDDGDCCSAFCELEDLGTPTLSVSLSPNTLWPPNHKLVPVSATLQVGNTCDPTPTVQLASITSNEPDNGLGDSDTANDIQRAALRTDDRSFSLRAERSGKGSGRVYTVTYQVADVLGNSTTATGRVSVPKNQR